MAEMKIGFVTFNPGSGDGDQAAARFTSSYL
jgi:hypothetical protein